MFKLLIFLFALTFAPKSYGMESLDGFLVTAYDDRFRVISPDKFKNSMEVVIENKTLVRLIGKLVLNNKQATSYITVDAEKFKKAQVKLKKGDILHFVPLAPAFQEVELIVGNKTYEIPPKK